MCMLQKVKLPAKGRGFPGHASGEQNVSKESFPHIVSLDPAYPALAGLAGHLPVKFLSTLFHIYKHQAENR